MQKYNATCTIVTIYDNENAIESYGFYLYADNNPECLLDVWNEDNLDCTTGPDDIFLTIDEVKQYVGENNRRICETITYDGETRELYGSRNRFYAWYCPDEVPSPFNDMPYFWELLDDTNAQIENAYTPAELAAWLLDLMDDVPELTPEEAISAAYDELQWI